MKKLFFSIFILACLSGHTQKISFNNELDLLCKTYSEEASVIPEERRATLDGIAKQLSKKKLILFTCRTNSRRTVMLQTWAQTSFYYYSLWDKIAFSIGDTITDVYPGVAETLSESGFICTPLENTESNGYIVTISYGYENIILSKKELGFIDTAKVSVVKICYGDETSDIAESHSHMGLPYQSPRPFENTPQEKQKYTELNRQIAIEMLYMAGRTKLFIAENKATSK